MSQSDLKATAKVAVLVEVSFVQPWSPEETMQRMHSVAAREAVELLQRVFSSAHTNGDRIEVIGAPSVKLITYEAKP